MSVIFNLMILVHTLSKSMNSENRLWSYDIDFFHVIYKHPVSPRRYG